MCVGVCVRSRASECEQYRNFFIRNSGERERGREREKGISHARTRDGSRPQVQLLSCFIFSQRKGITLSAPHFPRTLFHIFRCRDVIRGVLLIGPVSRHRAAYSHISRVSTAATRQMQSSGAAWIRAKFSPPSFSRLRIENLVHFSDFNNGLDCRRAEWPAFVKYHYPHCLRLGRRHLRK